MRRPRRALGAVGAAVVVSGCGHPAATNAPLVLRGAVSGVYSPGPPASCGPGDTTVKGPFGPNSATDVAILTVSDTGGVNLTLVGGRGTFSGSGSAFRQGIGWDVDATLNGTASSSVTITGHLAC